MAPVLVLAVLLLQDAVTLTDGKSIEGAIAYKVRGLDVGGTFVAWKKLASIRDEADPVADSQDEGPLLDALAADGRDEAALGPMLALAGAHQPATPLRPPFEGRWHALVDSTKHHRQKVWALYAVDFMKVDAKGRYTDGQGDAVENYLGWDLPVYAAGDGVVVTVIDGFDDNPVNQVGDYDKANIVTIRHEGDEHTTYAHLRKGSAAVKVGDEVRAGQSIGRVGNSGATAVPHLHFTLMRARTAPSGTALWVSVPFDFGGCTLARVGKTDVEIALERARVQEDWTLVCPAP